MVLPTLDGSFGCVAAVAVWGYALEIDVVFFECFFEIVGTFVIEDVESGSVAVGLEFGVQGCPGFGEFAGLASFEWLGKDGIAVVVVENHYVVIAV